MPSRCPSCSAFVSVQSYINLQSDWVKCSACGHKIHCPSVFSPIPGTRRPEPRPFDFHVAGSTVNVHISKLLPNGKISKRRISDNSSEQIDLFGGAL